MSVRKFNAKLMVVAVTATGLSVSALGAAQAAAGQEKYFDLSNTSLSSSATISTGALIGVGSDTIQFLDGALGEAYNTAHSLTVGTAGAITSLSSCQPPATGASTLTSCTSSGFFPEAFPSAGAGTVPLAGSSGKGANAIDGTGNATLTAWGKDVAFGRGSGTKNTATVDNLPFAVDQLVAVVSNKVASNAPATITLNELAGIYSGIYTNWAQLGGNNAPIHAYYINDSSSGTYQFFGKQLEAEEGKSTADNGVAAYAPHGTVGAASSFVSNVDLSGNPIKEHDPSAIQSDPNAITALSYSRVKLSAAENGGTSAIKPLGGYIADRAVYTFLRDWVKDGADVTKPALAGVPADWITNVPSTAFDTGGAFASSGETYAQYQTRNLYTTLFGPSGYFCDPAQKSTIEAQGFFQLSSTVCGKDVSSDPALTATDMPAISKTSGTLPTTGTAGSTTISANVAPKSGTGTPTGTVTFTLIPVNAPSASLASAVSGGSVTAPLSGGVATATVPASVPAGTYQVAATYSGDASFQSSWTDYDVTSGSAPVPSTITISHSSTTTPPPPVVVHSITAPHGVIKVKKGKATVSITVQGYRGTLLIKSGKKVIARVVITKDGVVTIKIKASKLKAGLKKYTIVLPGAPTQTIKIKK